MPRKLTEAFLNGLGLNKIEALGIQLADPDSPEIRKAALVLVAKTQAKLSHPGSGRLYKSRGVTSRLAKKGTKRRIKQLHQASAPGEPPAPDISELRRSVSTGVIARRRAVGTPLDYAAALEFGTKRIKPRPAWRPAMLEAKPEMTQVIVQELRVRGVAVALRGD